MIWGRMRRICGGGMAMGYRIRYGRKRNRLWLWWLAAVPVLAGTAVFGRDWYWAAARYVGACIRGG